MLKIFISHSIEERDKGVLKYLNQRLIDTGFTPFLSGHNLTTGKMISNTISQKIQNSDLILVFLSNDAAKSPFIQQEISIAIKYNKPFLIIKEKGVEVDGWLFGKNAIEFDPRNTNKFVEMFNSWLLNTYNKVRLMEEQERIKKAERNALIGLGIIAGALLLGSLFSKDK